MEWQVVTVIIALVGLIGGIATPIIKLTSTIATLTKSVNGLEANIKEIVENNTKAHQRLWDKNDKQDERITNHEGRISNLEGRDK